MIKAAGTLIIAGTGRNSGKSTLATLLILKYRKKGITGVKITPHPHPEMSGLTFLAGSERFQIYEEKNDSSGKDTSRMLRAGAIKVFLIVSSEQYLEEAYNALQPFLPQASPVVYESPSLRNYLAPDLFILMRHSDNSNCNHKNIDSLLPLADLVLTVRETELSKADIINLDEYNHWHLK